MDAATLRASMAYTGYAAPLPLSRYRELVAPLQVALRQANCTTVKRVAMFLAQIGAESGSLRWQEELASGSAYEWRTDLGNTQAGDGVRFKGRSFIQITGRSHYANLSRWAHDHGYVPTATYFVDHPAYLAADRYAFLGPVWYWVVARPQMNKLADAGDINGATYAVNGGYNNLSGRTARWRKCLTLGSALLPTEDTLSAAEVTAIKAHIDQRHQEMYDYLKTQLRVDGVRVSALNGLDNNDADKAHRDGHVPETLFMGIPNYKTVADREAGK